MTDGAGIANIATLRAIQRKFEFDCLPTAVQVRINGTKVPEILFALYV